MPLRQRIARWIVERRSVRERARMDALGHLGELLAYLEHRYVDEARARGTVFRLEVDPALAPSLPGPLGALGETLARLLDRAVAQRSARVALHVDVVGDDARVQIVHFTVAHAPLDASDAPASIALASATMHGVGGTVHAEHGTDAGHRVIVELAFELPRPWAQIDVAALRSTLGGDAALREVIVALDGALRRDLADLERLLAEPGTNALQAWLHRVSGALGMAEATALSRVGLSLERELEKGRQPHLDTAIRRFADDARQVLVALHEQVPPIGYSPDA